MRVGAIHTNITLINGMVLTKFHIIRSFLICCVYFCAKYILIISYSVIAGANVRFDMFVRMCGGDFEMGTGCSDMTKYEDGIRECMGASVANLVGVMCVCEEENCNVQHSSELIPDKLKPDKLIPDQLIHDKLTPDGMCYFTLQ